MKKPRFYYGEQRYTVTCELWKDLEGWMITPISDNFVPMKRVSVCGMLDTDTETLSFGVAVCSEKDRFEKAIGRKLAEERAVENPIVVVSVTKETTSETFMKIAKYLEDYFLDSTHLKMSERLHESPLLEW